MPNQSRRTDAAAAVKAIQAAGARGALSPASALKWARSIARGEAHPDALSSLAAGPGEVAAEARAAFEANQGELVSEVVSILSEMRAEPAPESWPSLFPPGTYRGQATPGYLDSEAAEITDAEADSLYPPRTMAAVEAAHRQREAAAGQILPYDDAELHDLLFGSSGFDAESGPDNAD